MSQPSPESKQKWLDANWYKRPKINRESRLRRFYGITPEEYEEMLEQQGGKCAICGVVFGDDKKTSPHVDHDHSSRFVRGILCQNCNFAIGLFEDDVDKLQSAIDYLISNATPTEFHWEKIPFPKYQHTEEWKQLASERQKGNKHRQGYAPWNKGKPWSDEAKAKMSASAKNRGNN
jgi:hypothetical protein